MADEYRTWYASTEQEWVYQCAEFMEHVVGWYRAYTHSDTGSNRQYTWISEGEVDDKRPPRLVTATGLSNLVRFACPLVGSFDFTSGAFNSPYLGDTNDSAFSLSEPGRCRTVANKDRIFMQFDLSLSLRYSGYAGFIDSFYSPADDPNPVFIRGQYFSYEDWGDDRSRMLRSDNTEVDALYSRNLLAVYEGYPNPRNGKLSFHRPLLYYATAPYSEVRGRLKGVYGGSPTKLAHGSFVDIGGDYYLIAKNGDEVDVMAAGPVSSNGQIPVNRGWMPRANLEADYTYRGLELDLAVSGTLALWRFDTGHLDNYIYGSSAALPVPDTYPDVAGNYDLTPQNSLTSVKSRLREAADFDGSTHYATATGDGTSAAALKEEWTFECVFKPDVIPTGGNRATLLEYGSGGGAGTNNTLIKVMIAPAVGTTPDAYNVERGNINVLWEKSTGTAVDSLAAGDFIQQDRWNYVAIVKKYNGFNYDIDVWHCSFGDHIVPTKKATFTNVDNATSGTSSDWYVGVSENLTDYFDGQIDDTRVTERVLTDEEIINNCFRTML